MKKKRTPFFLFKLEKAYYYWIISIILALAVSIFVPGFFPFFANGQGVVFVIALIVPFFPELWIPLLIDKKKKNQLRFIGYKIFCSFSGLFLLVLLFTLLPKIDSLEETMSVIFQSILILLSFLLVLFMYAVSKMDTHSDVFNGCDDIPYVTEENTEVEDLSKKVDKREKVGEIDL